MVDQINSTVLGSVASKPPTIISNAMMLEHIIESLCLKDAKNRKLATKKAFLQKIANLGHSVLMQIATYREHGYISDADLPTYYKILKDNGIDSFKLEIQVASEYTDHKSRQTPTHQSVVFDSVQMLLSPLNELKEEFRVFESAPLALTEPPSYSTWLTKAYEVCITIRRICSASSKWHQQVDEDYIVRRVEAHTTGLHWQYVLPEILLPMRQAKSIEWRLDAIEENQTEKLNKPVNTLGA